MIFFQKIFELPLSDKMDIFHWYSMQLQCTRDKMVLNIVDIDVDHEALANILDTL